MKRKLIVLAALVFSMVLAGVNAQAQGCCGGSGGGFGAKQGWGTDPENDPVYKQFLEDTSDLRRQIEVDRAEMNTLLSGENPDTEKAKELSGKIFDNQQKLAALTRESGFGPGAGGCGSCGGGGRAYRGCPGAGGGFQGGNGGYNCPSCSGPGTGPGAAR